MTKCDKKRLNREKRQELFKLRDKHIRNLGYDIFPNFFHGKNPMSYTYKKDDETSVYGWNTYEEVLIHIEKLDRDYPKPYEKN